MEISSFDPKISYLFPSLRLAKAMSQETRRDTPQRGVLNKFGL